MEITKYSSLLTNFGTKFPQGIKGIKSFTRWNLNKAYISSTTSGFGITTLCSSAVKYLPIIQLFQFILKLMKAFTWEWQFRSSVTVIHKFMLVKYFTVRCHGAVSTVSAFHPGGPAGSGMLIPTSALEQGPLSLMRTIE